MSRYAQIPAPGCYVDTTRVGKTFTDLDRAVRAIRGNTRSVIRVVSDDTREGDRWLRVYEEGSPIVATATGKVLP